MINLSQTRLLPVSYSKNFGVVFKGRSDNQTKHKSASPITIKNYHHIDSVVSRGAKPTEVQISELRNHGYKHIISFCTHYDPRTGTANGLPQEAKWAEKQGIKFHWLPFYAKDNPPKNYIKKFFEVTDKARLNNERVFIHCRYGADRTGVFSAIYKIRNYKASLDKTIKEMLKYGHDAYGNPNLIPFVIKYKHRNIFNLKGPITRLLSNIKKISRKI